MGKLYGALWALALVGLALLIVGCSASPTQADTPPPPGFARIEQPNGFPAIQTFCHAGSRVFHAYTLGNRDDTQSLAVVPNDPTC